MDMVAKLDRAEFVLCRQSLIPVLVSDVHTDHTFSPKGEHTVSAPAQAYIILCGSFCQ